MHYAILYCHYHQLREEGEVECEDSGVVLAIVQVVPFIAN